MDCCHHRACSALADSSVLFEVGQSNPTGAGRTGHGMYVILTGAFCVRTRSGDWMREGVPVVERRGCMSANSSTCICATRACVHVLRDDVCAYVFVVLEIQPVCRQ